MTARRPSAPARLGARGRRFWKDTLESFDLSNAELSILTEACRTLDDLDRLATAIEEQGATVAGSQGQPVVNPALTEARGQRVVLHRLIAALQLPDLDGKPVRSVQSIRSQSAAQARWRGHQREA